MEYTARQRELIEEHREHAVDHDWWDNTHKDFKEVAYAFGIDLYTSDIHFSGFWSQGDGASFRTNNFTLDDILTAGIKTLQANTYGEDPAKFEGYVDEFHTLFRIVADKMGPVYLLHPDGKQVAEAWGRRITTSGHYCHSNTMRIDDNEFAAFTVLDEEAAERCGIVLDDDFEQALLKQLRACADALYRTLQEEYEYQTDDDQVWDLIEANGWDKEGEEDEQDQAA